MVWNWCQGGHVDAWDRIRSPQAAPHIQGHWIVNRDVKIIEWGKDNLLNKRMTLSPFLQYQVPSCLRVFALALTCLEVS